jgi:AbrB family looped-hinge helix DNA binding protein
MRRRLTTPAFAPPEFTTVSAKGQLVIPARVRRQLNITEGTRVAVRVDRGQVILQPVTNQYINSLRGILGDTSDMIEHLRRDHESEDR